jgi:histidine triad (HIT) family protein
VEEADAELVGKLFLAAAKVAKQVGIAEAGYRVVVNCNAVGGQTVFHLHLHLLGGRPMQWPPG